VKRIAWVVVAAGIRPGRDEPNQCASAGMIPVAIVTVPVMERDEY
jgi:hypothetical protein